MTIFVVRIHLFIFLHADLELQAGGRQAQGPCDLASAYPASLALASDPAELCYFARVSLSSFRNLFQGKEKSCLAGEGVGPSSALTFSLMPCGPPGRRSWDEREEAWRGLLLGPAQAWY